jgi:hypothetical protein
VSFRVNREKGRRKVCVKLHRKQNVPKAQDGTLLRLQSSYYFFTQDGERTAI